MPQGSFGALTAADILRGSLVPFQVNAFKVLSLCIIIIITPPKKIISCTYFPEVSLTLNVIDTSFCTLRHD